MTATLSADRLAPARAAGLIAVLRAPNPDSALFAIDALLRGGITGIEVTYSTPDAAAVIAEAVRRHGDRAYIGAGTVTTEAQAREAVDAGAAFLVSPGTLPALTAAMCATGAVTMTGAFTPTEVMTAAALGSDIIKIFPAALGGVSYLAALRGPFPDLAMMPTGGVTPDNMAGWFAAGAVAVGVGSNLVPASALASGDADELERLARLFAAALAEVPARVRDGARNGVAA